MSIRGVSPRPCGTRASLRFRRGMGGLIRAAAGLLLAAAIGAGFCYGAATETEKIYDGKVVSADVRDKILEIEYTGAKGAAQVDVGSVTLADATGRLARIELFKPGMVIRVKVKEVSSTRLTDPSKPPGKDNPPTTTVEKVIKEVRMAAPPATPAGTLSSTPTGTPAATHSTTPGPKPATPAVPVGPTATQPASTKSSSPLPPGAQEVLSDPPAELANLPMLKGNALLATLASSPEYQAEQITLRLKCFKVSVSGPEVQPDSAAVFYVTQDANLTAGDRDLGGPLGTVTYWKDFLESTNTFLPFTGTNSQHEVSAGIAKFLPLVPMADRRIAVAGTLKAPLEKLSPRVLAVVLMNGSKAVSNVVWFTLGKNAPAPAAPSPKASAPSPKAAAPAVTPAPATAVAPKQAARAAFTP